MSTRVLFPGSLLGITERDIKTKPGPKRIFERATIKIRSSQTPSPSPGNMKARRVKHSVFTSAFSSRAKHDSGSSFKIERDIFSSFEVLPELLLELDLRDTNIKVLPGEMKILINLRLLNLTNCCNLQTIEPGLISSLVRLKELYMLGSFSEWEVEKEGKRVGNASINELELLPDLTALQIQVQDPKIIVEHSRTWSSLTLYVISTPDQLKCQFQESLYLSFPAVNLENYYLRSRRVMDLYLPTLTSLVDWLCLMLRSTEYLSLAGDGSKSAMDELVPEGYKHLKQLDIRNCSLIKYFVNGVDQVLPANGLFPLLESLCLENLPLFMEIFHCQLPVGLLCGSPTQNVNFSNLRSVHISHCPKLQNLFSLSMARDLVQLEEIKIEYCEMIEEIFFEDRLEDGKISNTIEFSKLKSLELDTLPNLTYLCKNARIEFPQLREMCIQSLRKLLSFCPNKSDLPVEGNDDSGEEFLFNEKIAFGNLKKLEIIELESVAGIWGFQPSTNLFSKLEVLEVASCDTVRNLFSHSVAKVLVQLKHLLVEDCIVMQKVIFEDGETRQPKVNESLFPKLKILELRKLPKLERFCHMINGLNLPSLEDLTFYNCPGMKEFSGGRVDMPMLKCVKRDSSIYRIDGRSYTVEYLFNEKHLFLHDSGSLSGQYLGTEVEEFIDDEVLKGSIDSQPELSSQAIGGNKGASLQHDVNEKSFCSTSTESTTMEVVDADPPESYELGEARSGEDVLGGHFLVRTNANEGQKEEINYEAQLKVSIDMILRDQNYVKDCMLFCAVLPPDYRFTKDILVWLWIAEGFIKLEEDEIMEEVCIQCFDTLLNLDYIVTLGYDQKCKFSGKMIEFLQTQPLGPKFRKDLDNEQIDATKIERLSLAFKDIDLIDFGIIKQCSSLQTLIIHHCYASKFEHLPSDFFSELKSVKILNLSHTDIETLPSCVECLKELRFLDMSETPISWLPESISCFSNLQTLKLDDCSSLEELPDRTSELINLRHLILDVASDLDEMPKGIGKLSKLRTLSAFLIGHCDGRRIGELRDMNKLKGSFHILHLENVRTKEEAAEACLYKKQDLEKIKLQWCDLWYEKSLHEEDILESLRPPIGIQELEIIFYCGGVLPSWISDTSFSELVRITLFRCSYWDSLPSLGELPSLKFLDIYDNNEVVEIGTSFCRKQTNHHHVAFPKLEKLSFEQMSKLEKWTGLENGDFPCLRHLNIEYCQKFVGLPVLLHLDSLSYVVITDCPELSCLPEDIFPPNLEYLSISDCPGLEKEE